jgi:hypothetical protein
MGGKEVAGAGFTHLRNLTAYFFFLQVWAVYRSQALAAVVYGKVIPETEICKYKCVRVCVCVCVYACVRVRVRVTAMCVLIPLYLCPHTTLCLSSYVLQIAGLIALLLYLSSYHYMCPHTIMCPHATRYVSTSVLEIAVLLALVR